MQNEISCIILAGGKASRMEGKDKGIQPYKTKPLVLHVIDRLSPQVDDIVISANRNFDEYHSYGYPVCADNSTNYDGPLAGIVSAIPACKHEWILVVPCDMPDLPDNLVDQMYGHISEAPLIKVISNNRDQLVFLLHRTLKDSIDSFLHSGQHTVMKWASSQAHYTLNIDDDFAFNNINTFDQLNS